MKTISIISATILLFIILLAAPSFATGPRHQGDTNVDVGVNQYQGQETNVGRVDANITGNSGVGFEFQQNFGSAPEQLREIPFIPGASFYQLMPGTAPLTQSSGYNIIPLNSYFSVKKIFMWEEAKRLRKDDIIIYYSRYLPPEYTGRTEHCKPISNPPACYYPVAFFVGVGGEQNTAAISDTLIYYSMAMGGNRFLPVKEGADFERMTEGSSVSGYAGLAGIISNATGVGAGAGSSKSNNNTINKGKPFVAGFVLWVDDEKGGR